MKLSSYHEQILIKWSYPEIMVTLSNTHIILIYKVGRGRPIKNILFNMIEVVDRLHMF